MQFDYNFIIGCAFLGIAYLAGIALREKLSDREWSATITDALDSAARFAVYAAEAKFGAGNGSDKLAFAIKYVGEYLQVEGKKPQSDLLVAGFIERYVAKIFNDQKPD